MMSLLYILAGSNHFINPKFYKNIIPAYIPWHTQLVFISGILEILFGVLLIPLLTRRIAAVGIILLLVAIFPANINMTWKYWTENTPGLWITILRLPLQVLLIWWAYIFAKKPN
jgi:uncharacterized membrane protein